MCNCLVDFLKLGDGTTTAKCRVFRVFFAQEGYNVQKLSSYCPKAELLLLKLTPIICLMNFIDKKVGN